MSSPLYTDRYHNDTSGPSQPLICWCITINIIWSMDISISIKHTCDKDMWQVTLWQLPRMRKTIISHVDRCHYVDTHSKCTVRLMYLPALPVRNACLLKRMKWFIIFFLLLRCVNRATLSRKQQQLGPIYFTSRSIFIFKFNVNWLVSCYLSNGRCQHTKNDTDRCVKLTV